MADQQHTCEWPGCSAVALCLSGNFGGKLVCREHFRITNGRPQTSLPDPFPVHAEERDQEENIIDNPRSWTAWKRESERLRVLVNQNATAAVLENERANASPFSPDRVPVNTKEHAAAVIERLSAIQIRSDASEYACDREQAAQMDAVAEADRKAIDDAIQLLADSSSLRRRETEEECSRCENLAEDAIGELEDVKENMSAELRQLAQDVRHEGSDPMIIHAALEPPRPDPPVSGS